LGVFVSSVIHHNMPKLAGRYRQEVFAVVQ
jgi:hypothetical protein